VVEGVEILESRISWTSFVQFLVDTAQIGERDVDTVCLMTIAVFGGAGKAGATCKVPHSAKHHQLNFLENKVGLVQTYGEPASAASNPCSSVK
jgi:hypothetical protein